MQSATSLVRDPSRSEVMLWDFSKPQSVAQWDCVSDEEMGGQSQASFQGSDKGAGPAIEGRGGSDVHVCVRPHPIQGMPPSLGLSPPSSHQEGTCSTAAMQPPDQGQQRCMCTRCTTASNHYAICAPHCTTVYEIYLTLIVFPWTCPHRRGCSFGVPWIYPTLMLLSCVSVVMVGGILPTYRRQGWPGETTFGSV